MMLILMFLMILMMMIDVRESDEVGEQDLCQAYDDNGDDNAGDDDNGDNGEVTVGALCSEIGSGRGAAVDKVGE